MYQCCTTRRSFQCIPASSRRDDRKRVMTTRQSRSHSSSRFSRFPPSSIGLRCMMLSKQANIHHSAPKLMSSMPLQPHKLPSQDICAKLLTVNKSGQKEGESSVQSYANYLPTITFAAVVLSINRPVTIGRSSYWCVDLKTTTPHSQSYSSAPTS